MIKGRRYLGVQFRKGGQALHVGNDSLKRRASQGGPLVQHASNRSFETRSGTRLDLVLVKRPDFSQHEVLIGIP